MRDPSGDMLRYTPFSVHYGWVTSNTRLSGEGPNDAHGATPVWFTPGFDQSHTPSGKIECSRINSSAPSFSA
jgi:hypothetical protein